MTEPKLTKIAVFEGTTVRKTLFNKEWWFSVVDVCRILNYLIYPIPKGRTI